MTKKSRLLYKGEGRLQYLSIREYALKMYNKGLSIAKIHRVLTEQGMINMGYYTFYEYLLLDPDFVSRPKKKRRIKEITQEEIENFKQSQEE